MAHALQYSTLGDPKTVLSYTDVPKPKLDNENHVIIRVHASPINPIDLYAIMGLYPLKPKSFPGTPGLEGAGVIVEVGSAVKTAKVGQRVYFYHFGAWQDYAVLDSTSSDDFFLPIPDAVSFEEACQLTVNPLTVTGVLHYAGIQFGKGETLLITQGASAIGRMMVQLGKLKGFKTITVVRRSDQIEELKALGADYVINSTDGDISGKVNEITQGAGVKYAADFVGGEVGAQVLKSMAFRGTMVVPGGISRQDTPFGPLALIGKGITIKGFNCSHYMAENPSKVKEDYAELLQLLESKKLKFAFKAFQGKDFKEAIDHGYTPGNLEKAVLVFNL